MAKSSYVESRSAPKGTTKVYWNEYLIEFRYIRRVLFEKFEQTARQPTHCLSTWCQ